MKQFIVLMSTIALGMVIYQIIIGPQDSSIISTMSEMWKNDLALRTYQ